MHIAGIIAEYNPFHNGHLYQIRETRKLTQCDFLVIIMSGSFSQRGTPTVCDKFKRAKMALLNGADLVLELPVPFATASAEIFAHYAVTSFHQTHLINTLSFGSEVGCLSLLDEIAQILIDSPSSLNSHLQSALKEGLSFPRAREKAILSLFKNRSVQHELTGALKNPNNILGIEYLKALKRLNSSIKPLTIKRTGTGYHDLDLVGNIASATAIRTQMQEGSTHYKSCIPPNIHSLLANASPLNMDPLTPFIHYKLMFSPIEDLYAIWDIPDFLIHSLVNTCHSHLSYEELAASVTSKTYTRATVNRSLLRLLLNIKTETMLPFTSKGQVPYLRVLGCRKDATSLLKALIRQSDVPVITNFAKQYSSLNEHCHQILNYELTATKLYHYLYDSPELMTQDFTHPFLLV